MLSHKTKRFWITRNYLLLSTPLKTHLWFHFIAQLALITLKIMTWDIFLYYSTVGSLIPITNFMHSFWLLDFFIHSWKCDVLSARIFILTSLSLIKKIHSHSFHYQLSQLVIRYSLLLFFTACERLTGIFQEFKKVKRDRASSHVTLSQKY